jgi:hypothetical protein
MPAINLIINEIDLLVNLSVRSKSNLNIHVSN